MPRGEPNVARSTSLFCVVFYSLFDFFARCAVCRAEIKGWDGRGGGVIGIKARAIFSI